MKNNKRPESQISSSMNKREQSPKTYIKGIHEEEVTNNNNKKEIIKKKCEQDMK